MMLRNLELSLDVLIEKANIRGACGVGRGIASPTSSCAVLSVLVMTLVHLLTVYTAAESGDLHGR